MKDTNMSSTSIKSTRMKFTVLLVLLFPVFQLCGQFRPDEDTALFRRCRVREMREYNGSFYQFTDTVSGYRTRTVSFDERGHKIREVYHLPNGNLIYTMNYDSLGRLSGGSQYDESNKTTVMGTYTYNAQGWLAEEKSTRNGYPERATVYSYDAKGRVIKKEEYNLNQGNRYLLNWNEFVYGPGNQKTLKSYSAPGNTLLGETRSWTNTRGNLIREEHWFKDTLHGGWEYVHDAEGHLVKTVSMDARWKPISTQMNSWSRDLLTRRKIWWQGKGDTATSVITYYPDGLPKQFMQKAKGYAQEHAVRFTYDAEGRKVRMGKFSNGKEFLWTTYTYNSDGNLAETAEYTSASMIPRSLAMYEYYPGTDLVKTKKFCPVKGLDLIDRDEMPDPYPDPPCVPDDTITLRYVYEEKKCVGEYMIITCETQIDMLRPDLPRRAPHPIPGPGPDFPALNVRMGMMVVDTLSSKKTEEGHEYQLRMRIVNPVKPDSSPREFIRTVTLRDGNLVRMQDSSLNGEIWLRYSQTDGKASGELMTSIREWKGLQCIQFNPYSTDTLKVITWNDAGDVIATDSHSSAGIVKVKMEYLNGRLSRERTVNANHTNQEVQYIYDSQGQLTEKRQYFMGMLTTILCKWENGRLAEEFTPDISNHSMIRYEYEYREK